MCLYFSGIVLFKISINSKSLYFYLFTVLFQKQIQFTWNQSIYFRFGDNLCPDITIWLHNLSPISPQYILSPGKLDKGETVSMVAHISAP